MQEGQVRDSYLKGMNGKDIAIIEGVRGLYEGIDSVNDIGSTASIAKSLNAPVILIINSRSLVKSAAAIALTLLITFYLPSLLDGQVQH